MQNLTIFLSVAQITLFSAFIFNVGRLILSVTIKTK